jgi:Family of unknown function (DUF6174)
VRRHRIPLIVFLLLAPLALGAQCSVTGLGSGSEPRTLEEARRRWDAADVVDYTYVLRRNCFCAGGVEPVRIVVRAGAAISYTLVETGETLPEEWRPWYPTVGGLFEFLEDAVDRDAQRIDVRYDDRLGYPVTIYVDYDERIADEEMGYEIRSFEQN